MTPHVTFYLTLKIFVPQTLFFISAPFLVGGGGVVVGVVDGHGAAGGGKLIEAAAEIQTVVVVDPVSGASWALWSSSGALAALGHTAGTFFGDDRGRRHSHSPTLPQRTPPRGRDTPGPKTQNSPPTTPGAADDDADDDDRGGGGGEPLTIR